jgi:hypothetical protein
MNLNNADSINLTKVRKGWAQDQNCDPIEGIPEWQRVENIDYYREMSEKIGLGDPYVVRTRKRDLSAYVPVALAILGVIAYWVFIG